MADVPRRRIGPGLAYILTVYYSFSNNYVNCDVRAVGWHDQKIRETHHVCNGKVQLILLIIIVTITIRDCLSPGFPGIVA